MVICPDCGAYWPSVADSAGHACFVDDEVDAGWDAVPDVNGRLSCGCFAAEHDSTSSV